MGSCITVSFLLMRIFYCRILYILYLYVLQQKVKMVADNSVAVMTVDEVEGGATYTFQVVAVVNLGNSTVWYRSQAVLSEV